MGFIQLLHFLFLTKNKTKTKGQLSTVFWSTTPKQNESEKVSTEEDEALQKIEALTKWAERKRWRAMNLQQILCSKQDHFRRFSAFCFRSSVKITF